MYCIFCRPFLHQVPEDPLRHLQPLCFDGRTLCRRSIRVVGASAFDCPVGASSELERLRNLSSTCSTSE